MYDYEVTHDREEELEWGRHRLTVRPYDDVVIKGESKGKFALGCSSSGRVVLCECSLECLPMGELSWYDDWNPYHLEVIKMTAEWIAGERDVSELWNGLADLETIQTFFHGEE